jgi:hypothetical protein
MLDTSIKRFLIHAYGACVINLFTAVINSAAQKASAVAIVSVFFTGLNRHILCF